MMFFEDIINQELKTGQIVCGDFCLCERNMESTVFVMCDGVGSGVYANIAAISCANRLMELFKTGISFTGACGIVASSMHRARTEDIPFSAFAAVKLLYDGNFTVYTYEAPDAVLIKSGLACQLKPRFYTVGSELIGEAFGNIGTGDSLLLCSDGVTQAGLGKGYDLGMGVNGLVSFLNKGIARGRAIDRYFLNDLLEHTAKISGGCHADDTTAAFLKCREARQLTIMTGPPSQRARDKAFVDRLHTSGGIKVVCGSTTADIVSRELGEKVTLIDSRRGFGAPPEYVIEGLDMVTEGAVVLNQANNILAEDPDSFSENTVVERLCRVMQDSDVITFLVGGAFNDAHSALLFKQIGVRPRKATVELIAEKLRKMGKLVVVEDF